MPPSDDALAPTPDSLFAAWLTRHEAGREADFEALCRDHPRQAERLRTLHAHWSEVEAVRRQHGDGGSLSEKLRTQYGPGVDPQVTLEGEEPVQGDFSSEVLSRLAGRGPASTRYRIKGEVAHGGMGAVLRVWDEDLRRHLAMKVMLGRGSPTEQGDTPQVDARMLARFLEEAQVTGQLDHPGIVPVHELGLDAQGRVYFTMKLVKGTTLKDVFDELARGEGAWTQTRVLGLVLKVCEAMAYAHDKGVIHRDLKPANIMVGRYGEVFVMDWGLAKIVGREGARDIRPRPEPELTTSEVRSERHDLASETPDMSLLTMDGDVVGTPAYMPPEQAAGRVSEMAPPSDVYAVGAMLYHLLAGHMPYVPPGARLNNYAVWQRVQEGPPRALHEVAPQVPAELAAICDKAMAREADARYPDMSALADDLSAYLEGRVVHAYEAGAWAEARKWVQRNRLLAASMAVAALAVVAGGLAFALKADEATHAAQRAIEESTRAGELASRLQLALDSADSRLLPIDSETLWPPHPAEIPALESWLVRAREMANALPGHREALQRLRARAHPWSAEERRSDRETHPAAGELAQKTLELEGLIARLEQGLEGQALETAEKRVAELEPLVAALTEEVESRRTWSFDTPEDQWQHDVLAELIGNLERMEAGLLAEDAIVTDHGWSVPRRLAFARQLEAGFAEGGEYATEWARALPAIREAYPGLDLTPQIGLVPIGPDPGSGLWEFAHLMTGVPPGRDADGRLVLTEEAGMVLVLLPGGSFWMGAQSSDPDGHNYDPQARPDEGPVHEVQLGAFFLSKYELTQAQWQRLTGRNPSYYTRSAPAAAPGLHPVEQLSWEEYMQWLPRAGLTLPSEAQWEYGARAGTQTPWWTGAERESLRTRRGANLADQAAARDGSRWAAIRDWPELDDGHAGHAPAGTYSANAFGLHEVAGNLWEWCLDGYDASFYGRSPEREPLGPWDAPREGLALRVTRGGSFMNAAVDARSARRSNYPPSHATYLTGVRPARDLAP